MLPLTLFLAKLIGLLILVFSLLMAMNKRAMLAAIDELVRSRGLILIAGSFNLAAGLAIVLGHNVWSGSALTVAVTLIGWLVALRGVVWLFMPQEKLLQYYEAPTFRAEILRRFLSHGCVRVDGIRDLATWLLNANSNDHWDRDAIVDAVREGGQKKIDLARAVPVAWIYLGAWASADGTVHYRPDVYGLDGEGGGHQTRRWERCRGDNCRRAEAQRRSVAGRSRMRA